LALVSIGCNMVDDAGRRMAGRTEKVDEGTARLGRSALDIRGSSGGFVAAL